MNFEKDSKKRDRELLANELRRAGASKTDKRNLRCPFHDDHTPSAEIKQAGSGFWYFYCYPCGISADVFELRARIEGRDVGEVLKDEHENGQPTRSPKIDPIRPKVEPEKPSFDTANAAVKSFKQKNPAAIIEEVNKYTSEDPNHCEYLVIRYLPREGERKKFMPISKRDGRWRYEHPAVRPLYRLDRIALAQSVLIVEGEKCVNRFYGGLRFGEDALAATTCSGGSNGVHSADLRPLEGKAIYIWADFDGPGEKYAKDLTEKLQKIGCTVVRVRTEDLGLQEKQDLFDLLDAFPGTPDQQTDLIESILQAGERMDGLTELWDHFGDVRAGRYRNVHFPNMPVLSHQSKALLPGSVSCICGQPNAAKSLLMSEWFLKWVLSGETKVSLLMLEENTIFYQKRALQQLSGAAVVNDVDLHAADPDRAEEILRHYEAHVEAFTRILSVTNSRQLNHEEIVAWVTEQFEAGSRIVGIDPITAVTPTANPWIADSVFMFKLKAICDRYQGSAILMTHPRGGASKPDLSSLGGGLAYSRFSQCVLWLANLEKPTDSQIVVGTYNTVQKTHEQTLQIQKARSGIGRGRTLAVNFDRKSLCFEEIGLIQKEDH